MPRELAPEHSYDGTRIQLFLIGAAKSGTTAMTMWLGSHPDILVSDPKEPFFFERFFENGLDDYWETCYAHRWAGQPIVVDARHRNQYLPFVPDRIAECAPNPLFLSLLREPVAAAFSHWWHWRSRGVEPLDFADAIKADWERVRSGIDFAGDDGPRLWSLNYPELGEPYKSPNALRWRTYVDTGFYDEQLERYIERFGRDRLLVIFTDELRDAPERTCWRVADFLGIEPSPDQRLTIANTAYRPPRHPPTKNVRWLISTRARVLPSPSYQSVGHSLSRPRRIPRMDRATAAFLRGIYAPHNTALEQLLGRPLPSAWR